jgi:chromosome partitioning protein
VVGDRFDVVVIDTPPLEDQRGIVMSALQAATDVLVPVAPTPIECERLPAVREAIEAASDLRPSGQPPRMAVLLTRTVAGAASTGVYRELLQEAGDRVLSVNVGRLERFAQAYGDPIVKASTTAYGDAVTELLNGVRA